MRYLHHLSARPHRSYRQSVWILGSSIVFLGLMVSGRTPLAIAQRPDELRSATTYAHVLNRYYGWLGLWSDTSGSKRQPIIVSKSADIMQSLNGTSWILSTWNQVNQNGGSLNQQPITITFTDNRISGFSGCNRFSGPYHWEGNRLKIGEIMASTRGCEPGVMERETAFIAALSSLDSVQVIGNQLHLGYKTANGESGSLGFTRQ
uniref:DUF306 domain-containing protein n=1 Tax=Cyanothece sp. (strain PCC 7425 / ATCC 29141) TaxID=395961 RepID=B8HRX5_CYAP4